MPQAANITVKKNDGTTDIVYTTKSPSSGDSVPAVWRSETVGQSGGQRPEFRLVSKNTRLGGEDAREIHGTYAYPQLVTDTNLGGLVSVKRRAMFKYTGTIPKDMTQTDVNEAVSQFANLLASTLVKDSAKDGFAPT